MVNKLLFCTGEGDRSPSFHILCKASTRQGLSVLGRSRMTPPVRPRRPAWISRRPEYFGSATTDGPLRQARALCETGRQNTSTSRPADISLPVLSHTGVATIRHAPSGRLLAQPPRWPVGPPRSDLTAVRDRITVPIFIIASPVE